MFVIITNFDYVNVIIDRIKRLGLSWFWWACLFYASCKSLLLNMQLLKN